MIRVFACGIEADNFGSGLLKKWFHSLSKPTMEKICRYVRAEDRKRSFVGRLLMHYMLMQAAGDCVKDEMIQTGRYGKPYLNAAFQGLGGVEFNISHSGEWVVGAVSDRPVGIDIEEIKEFDIEIGKKYFTPDECEYVYGSNAPNLLRFYQIWCLKESCLKCVGKGLSGEIASIRVYGYGDFFDTVQIDHMGIMYLRLLDFAPGYAAALCTGARQQKVHIETVSAADMAGELLKMRQRRDLTSGCHGGKSKWKK